MYYLYGTQFDWLKNGGTRGNLTYPVRHSDDISKLLKDIELFKEENRYFLLIDGESALMNVYHKGYLLFGDIP